MFIKTLSKISLLIALATITTSFIQCGPVVSQKSSLSAEQAVQGDSLIAFEQTLYPITKANCTNCHNSAGALPTNPHHADSDISKAHLAIINSGIVNKSTPANSIIYQKVKGGHQCWGNCEQNASEILLAIEKWAELAPEANQQNFAFKVESSQNLLLELSQSAKVINTDEVDPKIHVVVRNMSVGGLYQKLTGGFFQKLWVDPASTENNNITLQQAIEEGSIASGTFSIAPEQFSSDDTYRLFILGMRPNNNDRQARMSINDSHEPNGATINVSHQETAGRWRWRESGQNAAFNNAITAGVNNLKIFRQHFGYQIAAFAITRDPDFLSKNNPPNNADFIPIIGSTFEFDLQKILPGSGAKLRVDISLVDDKTYRFQNLRIQSEQNLYLKGVKPLINGIFNPRDASYVSLSYNVPAGQEWPLRNTSMIVAGEKGAILDKFGFAFDQIKLGFDPNAPMAGSDLINNDGDDLPVISFSEQVYPILQNYGCVECHNDNQNINSFNNYQEVINRVNPGTSQNQGVLMNRINNGTMPPANSQIGMPGPVSADERLQISIWIQQGALNN